MNEIISIIITVSTHCIQYTVYVIRITNEKKYFENSLYEH